MAIGNLQRKFFQFHKELFNSISSGLRKRRIVRNCVGYCCRMQGALRGAYSDIRCVAQRERGNGRQIGWGNSFFPQPLTSDVIPQDALSMTIQPHSIYSKSDFIIAKEIEDEFVIAMIPSITESSDELYFLNETGRELWEHLNGQLDVCQIIEAISRQYRKDFHEQIHKDILALIKDLSAHNIIVKIM